MTRKFTLALALLTASLAAGCGSAAETTAGVSAQGAALAGGLPKGAVARSATFLRDEEKLARDVYRHLQARYDQPPFAHIAGCEQRHVEAMGALAAAQGVPVASGPEVAGRFADPELQALYDRLVARGETSLEAALAVGALIEETDIADLQRALANAPSPDAQAVYQRLLNASHNHLRAFHRNLATRNAAYTPEVLARADYDAIVAGASGCGYGRGHGGGQCGGGGGGGGGGRCGQCGNGR